MNEQSCMSYKQDVNSCNQVRVDQGEMAMKRYSTFPKSQGLEPHHQMQFNFVPKTLVSGGLTFSKILVDVFYCPSR